MGGGIANGTIACLISFIVTYVLGGGVQLFAKKRPRDAAFDTTMW